MRRLCSWFFFAVLFFSGLPYPSCAATTPALPSSAAFPEKYTAKAAPSVNASALEKNGEEGILSNFGKRLAQIWDADGFDLYIPAYIWHNRLMYDKSKARTYNENPWGGGLGKSFLDEDKDRHYLFLMGFQDSHDMFEPYGGYAFMKNKHFGAKEEFSVGGGFVLGITARQEYDYIPFPLPLPIVGIQYKNLAVEATYIPGLHNDGNVLFTWIRLHFD